MVLRAIACALVAHFVAVPPLAAQQTPQIISVQEQPFWNAIGRVNRGGFDTTRLCTGTLIAPDLVLTAAHCVPPNATRTPEKLSNLFFVAGWNRGDYAAARTAQAVYRHPDYTPGDTLTYNSIAHDLALVVLSEPVTAAEATPLPLAFLPPPGEVLGFVGYRKDRRHAPTRYLDCVPDRPDPRVIFLNCPVVGGNSGSPVIAGPPEAPTVVGVIIASSAGGAYAVLPDDWLLDLINELGAK